MKMLGITLREYIMSMLQPPLRGCCLLPGRLTRGRPDCRTIDGVPDRELARVRPRYVVRCTEWEQKRRQKRRNEWNAHAGTQARSRSGLTLAVLAYFESRMPR